MDFLTSLCFFAITYGILSLSLNITAGYTRLLSLCQASFFAIGAYSLALIARRLTWSTEGLTLPVLFLLLLFGALLAAVVGGALSLLAIKLRGDYFLMATLAFAEIADDVVRNSEWSGGNLGIHSIPTIEGGVLGNLNWPLYLATVILLLAYWLSGRIERSHFGLALLTLASDEALSITLGNSPIGLRFQCMAVSAAMAATAGGIAAIQFGYIHPDSFGLPESILIFTMLIVGGLGSRRGAILGAFMLVFFPGLLTLVRVPSQVDANVRQIIYGLLLIVVMRLRPRGLAPA